jgi:hypothetical protein
MCASSPIEPFTVDLEDALATVLKFTAVEVEGSREDYPLTFYVSTIVGETLGYEIHEKPRSFRDACAAAHGLGVSLARTHGLSNIAAVFMLDEIWVDLTDDVVGDAILTIGVACTGERVSALQHIARDASGVKRIDGDARNVDSRSEVVDAFIHGLDSMRWAA